MQFTRFFWGDKRGGIDHLDTMPRLFDLIGSAGRACCRHLARLFLKIGGSLHGHARLAKMPGDVYVAVIHGSRIMNTESELMRLIHAASAEAMRRGLNLKSDGWNEAVAEIAFDMHMRETEKRLAESHARKEKEREEELQRSCKRNPMMQPDIWVMARFADRRAIFYRKDFGMPPAVANALAAGTAWLVEKPNPSLAKPPDPPAEPKDQIPTRPTRSGRPRARPRKK